MTNLPGEMDSYVYTDCICFSTGIVIDNRIKPGQAMNFSTSITALSIQGNSLVNSDLCWDHQDNCRRSFIIFL